MYADDEDKTNYNVVVNHEGQYSIWPTYRDVPAGWKAVGKNGPKKVCLSYISDVWTDMRPLCLRKKNKADAGRTENERTRPLTHKESKSKVKGKQEESLPARLSKGNHKVETSLCPDRTVKAFKKCIDRGYVIIKFTDTRGGTELGVRLDHDATKLDEANFERGTGKVHLVGRLTLDYIEARCVAEIDLISLCGCGHLEILS